MLAADSLEVGHLVLSVDIVRKPLSDRTIVISRIRMPLFYDAEGSDVHGWPALVASGSGVDDSRANVTVLPFQKLISRTLIDELDGNKLLTQRQMEWTLGKEECER